MPVTGIPVGNRWRDCAKEISSIFGMRVPQRPTPLGSVSGSSRKKGKPQVSSSQPAPGSLGWPPQVIRPQGRDQPTSPSKLPSKSRVEQAILQVSNGGPRGLNSKVDTMLSLPYTGCCPWYFPHPGPDPESPILQLPWPPSGTSSLLPLPDCLTAPSGRALPGYNRPISRGTYIAAIFLERLF